ncbi:hypothetical protein AV530_002830 [Patagioenas fasciata monilis]|uniref:Uncharacterized protein n=1 Tax=Patagioenas fasciata monilis TaxID=372326 RepID=A0A1V4K9B2_PATFA|nr:hypothetical protein AV530_002830 [Patagioenas fasciata monilis]
MTSSSRHHRREPHCRLRLSRSISAGSGRFPLEKRGCSQHAVPLDLSVITNHILCTGHLASIPVSSCFSEGYNLTLSWV